MAENHEARIRERAYHIWEASGRPWGRDEEFWHRACEMVATDRAQSTSVVQRPRPKQGQPAQQARKRGRQTSRPASSGLSAPPG